jgi:hypothetical protein
MGGAQVEYVGFQGDNAVRRYTFRARLGTGESCDFVLIIPNEAFLAHRVRYQDAPEICFLKLQREVAACGGGLPASCQSVTDADLEAYRVAHAPKSSGRHSAAH